MRLYLEIIKNSFYSHITYRFNTLLQLVSRLITMFIQISIWKALYNGALAASSNNGSVNIDQMISYVIISSGITIFISNNVISTIDDKIKSGELAMDLLKPLNLKAFLFCNTIGNTLYLILFQLLPLVVIAVIFFNVQTTNLTNLLWFTITVVNGMLIYFLITYLIGLIGFWYLSIWHFSRFLEDFVRLLSGSIIPLWFFPKIFIKITGFLPFKLIYYDPISIYLGKVDYNGILIIIIQQLFWIIMLNILQRFVWTKGVKKLNIQGG